MQVQPVPAAPVAAYTGALPAAAPTQPAVIPQAQPSLLVPTQQQVPNSQVLYAAAPGAVPGQGMVPPAVPQDPAQYQAGVLPANHGMTLGTTAVAGQTDLSAAPYGISGMQPVVSDNYDLLLKITVCYHLSLLFSHLQLLLFGVLSANVYQDE